MEAELLLAEGLRVPQARELHRIPSEPVLHIGPVGHSPGPVLAHDLKWVATS
jgi:hypothetical protein